MNHCRACRVKTGCSALERDLLFPLPVNAWAEEMKARTRRFALDVIAFVRTTPPDYLIDPLKKQLVRAATGIAANYRSACRARSHAEFKARLGVVLDEADEAEGWLDVFQEGHLSASPELARLRAESQQLRAMFAAANLTAQRNARSARS
jgi:four helix bundle protein